ncbi:MAG TPA: hypothetical protein VHA78_03630 [Candidatus Peribacteraceae bacterium]|nr:hypothetical protein [Candidatus Peribacteraceae bacterium]
MHGTRMWTSLPQRQRSLILFALLSFALLIKCIWPLFVYHIPLGYDVGIYRYLFVRHADGFPPFDVVALPAWAKGHPLGLFFVTTILIRLGIPADWLIGWIWNLFPVFLAILLGWVMMRREGKTVGLLTMLAALLSVAYFDGFAAMYWKTLASLFWCVLTYHLLERRSWIAVITGILTVATHHQTGLLFGLAFGSWVIVGLFKAWIFERRFPREILLPLIGGVIVLAVGLLWYLPVWKEAVMQNLPELFAGEGSPGGNFPPASFYLSTSGILLALGAVGLLVSLKRERFTLWQWSVLWCLLFVSLRLFFFRRFFLQLDFFLLPFAAIAIHFFWKRYPQFIARSVLVLAVGIQLIVTSITIATRKPAIDAATYATLPALAEIVPPGATIIDPENQSPPFLQGWLPYAHVAGPGLFETTWSYDQWKTFIVGSHTDRLHLLQPLGNDTYVYISPYFRNYYGAFADSFLADSCFSRQTDALYKVVCK